jgi:deazaflavin-dependent oxidoreductase (nitroreductase family)
MPTAQIEADFYRTLNALVEPIVRAGAGSPCVLPTGLIVLEVVGRRSGATHRIPAVATAIGDHVLVGTLRGQRSQWIKNLRANPDVRYWLHGQVREARALVFALGQPAPDTDQLPSIVRSIAARLSMFIGEADAPFVILSPRV